MILKFSKSFFIINENPPKLGGFFCFKVKLKTEKFAVKAGNFSVLNISSKNSNRKNLPLKQVIFQFRYFQFKRKSEKFAIKVGNFSILNIASRNSNLKNLPLKQVIFGLKYFQQIIQIKKIRR
jgi:hypothetical protein